jgi:plastocyanin
MRSKLLALLAVAGVAALPVLFAACGDDGGSGSGDDEEESTSTEAPVELEGNLNNNGTEDIGDATTVVIDAGDFFFEPTFVKAAPGADVQVTIDNVGDVTHTFTIDDQDVDVEVEPGDSAEVAVTLPEGAALRFYCSFHGSRGMQGALYSADGQAVAGVTGASTSGGSPGGYGY